MDDRRLPRPNIPANECKALLFLDEIEQCRDYLFMTFAQEEELLVKGVFEGGAGKTEVCVVHFKSLHQDGKKHLTAETQSKEKKPVSPRRARRSRRCGEIT